MKSFLQEIEDKFTDLEEATFNVKMDQLDKIKKDTFPDDAQVNVTEKKSKRCPNCGKPYEAHCGKHNEAHCGKHNEAHCNEELDEMSTTAAVAPVTGKYFVKDKKDKITYEVVQEAMDRKYEHLIESYRKFSLGEKNITPKRKVERTIQEVSKKLKEIETLVKHTSKLKTESGISRKEYGPRTEKALNKISEKLIKIAERVRAIGE